MGHHFPNKLCVFPLFRWSIQAYYHSFVDIGLLVIGILLKQGFLVDKLKSSQYTCNNWPQQFSVCWSEAFKFVRLVPCCDDCCDVHVQSIFDLGHVLFMSFVFIFAYWFTTRFHGVEDLLTLPEHHCFFSGVHVVLSGYFLYYVLLIAGCPFVMFGLPYVWYVHLWFTDSDYHFCIVKLYTLKMC